MTFSLPMQGSEMDEEKKMLEEFFTAEELSEEMFTDLMLTELPLPQLQQLRDNQIENLGNLEDFEHREANMYTVNFAQGRIELEFSVIDGEIAGLFFHSVTEQAENVSEVRKDFTELPGEVSLLVEKNGEELISHQPQEVMAVGSTFKVAVLAALQQEIEENNLSWNDTMKLQELDRSLPSGRLQNWPKDTSFTVESLAGRMISESDNTATDMLIRLIGREKAEEMSPHNRPFLTTREAFILRDPERAELLERYREATGEEKYQVLADMETKDLPPEDIFNEVRGQDIEWFFSADELIQLMGDVKDIDLMTINPGLADETDWERVAFKGGSSPGVLNYTHMVEDEKGDEYYISATWNHEEELEEARFQRLNSTLLNLLAQ